MTLLAVQGLTVQRGGQTVLRGVSFALAAGQALILQGPNGIGKTTLLRTLAGLQPPTGGQMTLPEEAMAYCGHEDGLKATMTVAENLRFWAEIFGTKGVEDAVAAMGLAGLLDRSARHLSAGQKRRLGLARLCVTGRAIWLLDEPTVSLDAGSVVLFRAMLRLHLAQGGAAVLATHIDLGLPEAKGLGLTAFKPAAAFPDPGDFADAEAFA